MNWKKLESFPFPQTEWDYEQPSFLFFSKEEGVNVGHCILQDSEERTYSFHQKGRDGYNLNPTHWMHIPNIPEDKSW